MLSIEDIGAIAKPIVWTLHDMWPFCGAEHYTEGTRWRDGYSRESRPADSAGLDLERWAWNRKRRSWKRPMHLVAPSRWLAGCVKESALMRELPVTVIPNAIDTELWRPVDKRPARDILGMPNDQKLVLFGAIGGVQDPNKGFELLSAALAKLQESELQFGLITFGKQSSEEDQNLRYPVYAMGHLYDTISLRTVYSAADVIVVPSRIESLGQTALEANACETPAIAFDNSGLTEIVKDQKTGWLVKAFDVEALANAIKALLVDDVKREAMAKAARTRVETEFSADVVAQKYISLYESVMRIEGKV